MPFTRSNRRSATALASLLFLSSLVIPHRADAQLITPKTVPVAQGDQFNIYPAANAGMAGVSIAIDDSLFDPWVNPARITRVRGSHLFSAPSFYSISEESGAGRTLPLGATGQGKVWSGGIIAALQQVDKGDRQQWVPELVSDRSGINQFASAVIGRRFERLGLSLGASGYWAGLDAVDGVDLLYPNAQRVEQFGDMADLRVGLTKVWSDSRALDIVLLYDRFDMTHDVSSTTWLWDSIARTPIMRQTTEHNQDKTIVWGGHAEYSRPLTAAGWRVGWMGTYNKLEHPKIPNYELMSVPRDPGSTRAFQLGAGLSRVRGPATFAVDVIYEPMWSDTWADAARDTAIVGGGTIKAGQKTVENDFTFSNAIIRMGVGRDTPFGTSTDPKSVGVQFGVAAHVIDYRLRQINNVQKVHRTQNEDWVEWTPSLGLTLRFPELELRYVGRITTGVGRPGFGGGNIWLMAGDAAGSPRGGGIIVAPGAPLALSDAHVVTHQLSFSMPIR
jgi:hypothetical protein